MEQKELSQFTAGQMLAIKNVLGAFIAAAPNKAFLNPLLDAAQQAAEARVLPEPVSEKYLDGVRDVFEHLRTLLERASE
ncbi:hypothetical protein KTE23_29050 [Burkholderia multivorans]|uniref:hypothetical protein n=1 Tax=Burkholderia multivorans TaxID=87883 RepID=UPI001C2502C8|nr:hypothetical protein [Burkholderia multivorans]MBU9420613.1 hypothetical protein [Burkholderia multivorans]